MRSLMAQEAAGYCAGGICGAASPVAVVCDSAPLSPSAARGSGEGGLAASGAGFGSAGVVGCSPGFADAGL